MSFSLSLVKLGSTIFVFACVETKSVSTHQEDAETLVHLTCHRTSTNPPAIKGLVTIRLAGGGGGLTPHAVAGPGKFCNSNMKMSIPGGEPGGGAADLVVLQWEADWPDLPDSRPQSSHDPPGQLGPPPQKSVRAIVLL